MFFAKYKYELFAFLIPFLAVVVICIGNRVYPFGNQCMLHIDMYHQYCPFFTEFLEKLKNGQSLFYTWNLGLGSDYVSLYAYYLASPFNWFLILLPKSFVIEFMELTIIIKIGLCGLFMYKFLGYHFNVRLMEKERLVFATAYALSGFVAAYSWDIMWMDTVALAPLVLLGLEKLVKEKKPTLYAIALAISIWSNYYIAIMLCIFLVFYFGWLFFTATKGIKDKLWALAHFGLYSLLAGGMSAVLILPEIVVLSYSGSSMGGGFPEAMEWYFNILAEISRMSVVTEVYTGTEHWPNLYCGIFAFLLMILYGFNRNISLKRKIPAYLMVVFFFLSFSNNILDFAWHGLHFPESLPGRQSFLFALLVLMMAFAAWKERKVYKIWQVCVAFGIAVALMIAALFTADPEVTAYWSYTVTALFMLLYLLIYLLIRARGMKTLLFVVVIAELIINMTVTGIGVTSRTVYTQNDADYDALIDYIEEEEGNQFYRVEDYSRLTKNDSSYHTYSSATVFSSLMNLDVSHFYQSVYMEGGKNYYCFNGATPMTSAMLSVSYVISKDELAESPYRTLVKQSGNLYLYKNTYTASLGFVLDEEVIADWDNTYVSTSERIMNLNELAELLGASEQYLTIVKHEEEQDAGSTTITIPEDGYYYAAYFNNSNDRLSMYSSSGYNRSFSKTSHRYLLDIGQCEAGETITITNSGGDTLQFNLFRLDESAAISACENLLQEQLEVTDYSDTSVEGTITTENGGRLVLSIPYVPGWTLKVDGEETEISAFCDAFISVQLESGTHQISLQYETPALKTGAIISALCILIFLLLLVGRRFVACKRKSA
ncbi:MAG: hypothetical protein E7282_08205 [Lachnospiraceae bacterium]|nr:hypothetical protein [Lachnospiraceae bacterium]